MRLSGLASGVGLATVLFFQGAAAQPGTLTFERRLQAQEAIERVYYSHQIGATRSFEEAVPRTLLEKKVRTYLKQSVALETIWKTPVTSEMLHRELERMAGRSRMPERLLELYAALGNDPVLVQESLARPALVDRLARNFFAYDATIHAGARKEAEALRQDLFRRRIDPAADHPGRMVVEVIRDDAAEGAEGRKQFEERAGLGAERRGEPHRLPLSPDEFDRYRSELPARVGEIGPVQEERESFVVRSVLEMTGDRLKVATFVVPKRAWDEWWESVENGLDAALVESVTPPGARLPLPEKRSEITTATSCLDDTWDNGASGGLPEQRWYHTAVWTGSLMIVWGGQASPYTNTGGRYDPVTDTWTPTSTANAPSARRYHTAVWTGSLMIVWGGENQPSFFNSGGRYDPATDTWTPTSTTNAPHARSQPTVVWTGSRMIVWGGWAPSLIDNSGGLYDPAADTWTPTSTTDAPSARTIHTAVWTGDLMVVWGGSNSNTGGRYDPATDTWTPTSTANAPSGRSNHTAVWTGSLMIVWGGSDSTSRLNTGGRYDPATDTWASTSIANVPSVRRFHTAVWAGSRMIVWGGGNQSGSSTNTGGRYDPVTDTWNPTSTTGVPADRFGHSAIWTGSRMIVWGGTSAAGAFNGGGRYDPASDSWTPTSTANAPSARDYHTAVWTGNVMVVWGGYQAGYFPQDGGRYDPATDTWTPTSTTNMPSPRADHTAVWTGDRMIVWGGADAVCCFPVGGRYDPVADVWTPTSTTNAPLAREDHSAVWTGTRMIVWGGWVGSSLSYVATGGRYDPATDTWTPTSTAGAPSGRVRHSAVWTGSRMVVWGGYDGASDFNTGGQYDPANDTWTPSSTTNAPSPRESYSTVWTGSRMIVWGGYNGAYFDTGAQYDTATDTWTPTSTVNAPSARGYHTAVWTGSAMVVWGGYGGTPLVTGGRYDPAGDTWTPTTVTNAPMPRYEYTAIWAGSAMIVWGGVGFYSQYYFNTGGRYTLVPATDDDGDGLTECQGDCNDGDATIHPGAVEICDGMDNNCDDVTDNAAVPVETPLVAAELSAESMLLTWPAVGLATAYDVVRGDLSTLRSSGGDFTSATQACSADDTAGTSLDITSDLPAVGNGFWYLARAINCGGHGTYDDGAQVAPRDAEIDAAPLSCP